MIKVWKTIEKYAMFNSGDRVGVAVSGGADSVALLHVLSMLASEYDLALFILHLNHGIRGGESDGDELFVKELGESMGIPADSEKVSIPASCYVHQCLPSGRTKAACVSCCI